MAKQFTVRLKNEPGALARLAGRLGEHGIDIRDLSAGAVGSYGCAVLSTRDDSGAADILRKARYKFVEGDVINVGVEDRPRRPGSVDQTPGRCRCQHQRLDYPASPPGQSRARHHRRRDRQSPPPPRVTDASAISRPPPSAWPLMAVSDIYLTVPSAVTTRGGFFAWPRCSSTASASTPPAAQRWKSAILPPVSWSTACRERTPMTRVGRSRPPRRHFPHGARRQPTSAPRS